MKVINPFTVLKTMFSPSLRRIFAPRSIQSTTTRLLSTVDPSEKYIPKTGPLGTYDWADPVQMENGDDLLTGEEKIVRDAARAYCQQVGYYSYWRTSSSPLRRWHIVTH